MSDEGNIEPNTTTAEDEVKQDTPVEDAPAATDDAPPAAAEEDVKPNTTAAEDAADATEDAPAATEDAPAATEDAPAAEEDVKPNATAAEVVDTPAAAEDAPAAAEEDVKPNATAADETPAAVEEAPAAAAAVEEAPAAAAAVEEAPAASEEVKPNTTAAVEETPVAVAAAVEETPAAASAASEEVKPNTTAAVEETPAAAAAASEEVKPNTTAAAEETPVAAAAEETPVAAAAAAAASEEVKSNTTAAAAAAAAPAPATPQPDEETGGYYIQRDGFKFFGKEWKPTDKAVAHVTFLHGLGEHILRYEHVFTRFAAKGIHVTAFDQRGHGRTSGRRGDGDVSSVTASDVEYFMNTNAPAETPRYIFGHSMGGFNAAYFAIHRGVANNVVGVLLSAPAFQPGFPVPGLKKFGLQMLGGVPGLGGLTASNELDVKGISRDPEVVEKYQKDKYVHPYISFRTANCIINGGQAILDEGYKNWKLPFFLAHGTKDILTSYPKSQEFFDKIALDADKKTFKSWEGLFHELHNEPEKDQVIEDYIRWIIPSASL